MPYNSKDWKPATYRDQKLTGIRQHKENDKKFLFDVAVKKIRRKKIVSFHGTQSERHQAAIKAYAEFRADIYEGYFLDPVIFDEMFNRWLALKPPTRWIRLQRGTYQNHIKQHIGLLNLKEITAKDIDRVTIAATGKAAATRKGIIGIVKSVLLLAIDEKIIKSLPIEQRHGVKVSAAAQKTVILEATAIYKTVYESIMTLYAHDPKWRAIFLFGLNGRRKSEILSMRWDHISLDTKTYIIKGENSKIKQDLTFIIPFDVLEAILQIKPKKPKGLIFPNPNTGKIYTDIRVEVQRVRDHSGWCEFGFHRMRNLLSSALYNEGVAAENLSSILGHTSPATLQRYLTMQRKEACNIVESAAFKLINMKSEA